MEFVNRTLTNRTFFIIYISKTNRIFLSFCFHFFIGLKIIKKMRRYETQYVQDNQEGDRHNNALINGRETQTQGESLAGPSSLPVGHLPCWWIFLSIYYILLLLICSFVNKCIATTDKGLRFLRFHKTYKILCLKFLASKHLEINSKKIFFKIT